MDILRRYESCGILKTDEGKISAETSEDGEYLITARLTEKRGKVASESKRRGRD